MDEKKFAVTPEGKKQLEEEYDRLIHVEREENKEALKAARAQGDLSENADYDAARNEQARIEARIKELDYMLQNLEIIEEKTETKGKKGSSKLVHLGSTVTIESMDEHVTETYTIVGTVEADPMNGRISNETPLAVALLEHKAGDTVTVNVAKMYRVKIKSVE